MSLPISTLTGANTIAQLIYNVNRIKTLAANTASTVANSTFQAALANTNAYIATKVNTTTFQAALANTNSYIATKTSTTTFNSALANTNTYINTKANTANPLFSGTVYVGGPAPVVLVGDSSVSTGDIRVELGSGRTGDGIAYIDLLGDTTYTDYGTRILRNATANGTTDLRHRGTGGLQIIAQEAAPIQFYTTDTERMRITATGQLLVGVTVSAGKIHVQDDQDGITYIEHFNTSTGASAAVYNRLVTQNAAASGTIASGMIKFRTGEVRLINGETSASGFTSIYVGGTERLRIDSSGNVGIGTSSPQEIVHAYEASGSSDPSAYQFLAQNFSGFSISAGYGFAVTAGGETFAPKAAITLERTTAQGVGTFRISVDEVADVNSVESGDAVYEFIGASGVHRWLKGGTERMRVAFPTGAEIVFFQVGAGNVQFANAAGVTVNSKDGALFLTGQFSAATLKKITTDEWDLIGDLA
jgi:hypothetical protein